MKCRSKDTEDTELWADIAREAISLHLRAYRIAEERPIQPDRNALRKVGESLYRLCRFGLPKDESKMPELFKGRSDQGIYLVLRIEKDYLQSKDDYYAIEELKKLKVVTLDNLAAVLKSASLPDKFDKYAFGLAKLFDKWHAFAEERSELGSFVGHDGKSFGQIWMEIQERFPTRKAH